MKRATILTLALVLAAGISTAQSISEVEGKTIEGELVSAMCYLTVSFGNLLTAGVNYFIQNEDGTSKLAGASYYAFFTGMMLVAAIVFVFVATFYQEKRYIHDEETVDGELSLS